MTELFACLSSWDCERERESLRPMARGTSIFDIAIGSVAALGPQNGEFQIADILCLSYVLNFHDREIAASSRF
jgi:hypothetical protein